MSKSQLWQIIETTWQTLCKLQLVRKTYPDKARQWKDLGQIKKLWTIEGEGRAPKIMLKLLSTNYGMTAISSKMCKFQKSYLSIFRWGMLLVVQEGLRGFEKGNFCKSSFLLGNTWVWRRLGNGILMRVAARKRELSSKTGMHKLHKLHKCTLACINLTEPLNGRPWRMKISNFIGGEISL